jgi:hypothetical protein
MARKAEIGLHRGTVKLVAHNPKWAECFSEEKELLFKTVVEKILDLRHIGIPLGFDRDDQLSQDCDADQHRNHPGEHLEYS